jgi:hypothetical protein
VVKSNFFVLSLFIFIFILFYFIFAKDRGLLLHLPYIGMTISSFIYHIVLMQPISTYSMTSLPLSTRMLHLKFFTNQYAA